MMHLLASGASGQRVELDEASVVKATAEVARILAKMEEFYLDGQRQDGLLQVRDCTEGETPWLADKSRVRGGVWRHYYKLYQVQYRLHRLGQEWLLSLFNWDPFQTKPWHLALPEISGAPLWMLDVEAETLWLHARDGAWNAASLRQGLVVAVPPAGLGRCAPASLPALDLWCRKYPLQGMRTFLEELPRCQIRNGRQHDDNFSRQLVDILRELTFGSISPATAAPMLRRLQDSRRIDFQPMPWP